MLVLLSIVIRILFYKMKIFILCCLTVLCGSVWAIEDRPNCSESPTQGNPLCDILPPECRFPKCGQDYNYKKRMWFGNECYMNQYNKICGTNFRKTADSLCDRNERPLPVLKPCPFPIRP